MYISFTVLGTFAIDMLRLGCVMYQLNGLVLGDLCNCLVIGVSTWGVL